MLYNNWMVANGHQSFFSPGLPPAQTAAAPAKTASGVPAPIATAPTAAALPGAPAAAPAIKTEIVSITTDLFKVDIDTAGGVIKRLELFKFKDGIDPTKNQVLMDVNPKGTSPRPA